MDEWLESCFAAAEADEPGDALEGPPPPPADLRDAVLHGDLLRVILAFVGAVPSMSAVCRAFDDAAQANVRHAARGLLAARLTVSSAAPASPATTISAARSPAMRLATGIEGALHAACGSRAGPGAYNAQLRSLVLNLSANADLRARVVDGRLAPAELARLPPSALASDEQRSRTAALLEAAVVAGRRAPPRADVEGLYACECGSARQTVRRVVRMGGDVTKYSETWTCTDCGAPVTTARPLFEWGSSTVLRAPAAPAAAAERKRARDAAVGGDEGDGGGRRRGGDGGMEKSLAVR